MKLSPSPRLILAGVFLLGTAALLRATGEVNSPAGLRPLTAEQQAAHVLNRLGYGPRPGEVAVVARTGVEAWMRRQLDPRKIADPAAETAVARFSKLKIPAADLVAAYQTEIRARRQEQDRQSAAATEMNGKETMNAQPDERAVSRERMESRLLVGETLGELMHAKLTRAVLSERQLEEVLVDFWFNHFNVDARKQQIRATVGTYEQETIRPHIWGSFRELLGATAESPAMLVYLDNARSSRAYAPGEMERAMQRRQQNQNKADDAAPPRTPSRGLNENYGRELLELHTLGVDGGYLQKDVQEVARAFTGWTLEPRTGGFVFRARMHDDGSKVILGKKIPAGGGERDGERVLDLLAVHPSTAHHLAYKLCQRFVADVPPADYVERVAQAFLRSKGNLRATYTALFLDPAFFDPCFYGAKSKSPFEFVVSSLRATGAELTAVKNWPGRQSLLAVEAGAVLGRGGERLSKLKRKSVLLHLVDMGQPLYGWAPPTGFSENSTTWIGAGALVSRLNFSLALAGGEIADARVAMRPLLGEAKTDDPGETVDALAEHLLAGGLSASTRRILLAQGSAGSDSDHAVMQVPRVVALLLGSPEFQKR